MLLNIHGLTIECMADLPEVEKELIRPFIYFKTDSGTPSVRVKVIQTKPPYGRFPVMPARFSTPRNIVYQKDGLKVIDYFGDGVVVEEKDHYTLYSTDKNFLKEAFYLLVLSLFGQYCDSKGLLRVHALALSRNNKAYLLLLPPGGGKSTMALAMLKDKNVRLLSDDCPAIDRSGYALPFPSHIGTLDIDTISQIPKEYVDTIDRMEFGMKHMVDCGYWKDQIERRPIKDITLIIGQRVLNGQALIEKTSKTKVLNTLIGNAVLGIGLYQGLEFIVQNSTKELIFKIPAVLRRLIRAIQISLSCKAYRFVLASDVAQNVECLKKFLTLTCPR